MDATLVLNPAFGFEELSNDELFEVDGGGPLTFLAFVAGAAAVIALCKAAYELGGYIGTAIYYATH
jgi:bacteriocin-like protein